MNILLKKYFTGLVGVVCLSITGLSYASTVDELISHIRQGRDDTALEIITNNDECIHTANAEGETALIVASRLGKEQLAQALIGKRAMIDHQDKRARMTGLHSAIEKDHTNIALMLIEAGANIELLTHDNQNALMISAKKQNSAIMRALLRRGATLDQQDYNGQTALHWAIKYLGFEDRESDCALQLIAAGANTDLVETDNGRTPLEAAIIGGGLDIVEKIIESGANIDRESQRDGLTPLQCAIKHDQAKVALMLIDTGASLQPQVGKTPFEEACRKGQAEVVNRMLQTGKIKPEQTHLLTALRWGHEDVALILIDAGADVTRADNGLTLLMLAAQNGQTEVLHKLLEQRVEINQKDRGGNTAFDHAIQNRQQKAAQILMNAGAKTDAALVETSKKNIVSLIKALSSEDDDAAIHFIQNNDVRKCARCNFYLLDKERPMVHGQAQMPQKITDVTPLIAAAYYGRTRVVQILLDKKVNLDHQDSNGAVALIWALYRGEDKIARILIEAGANTMIPSNMGLTPLMLAAEIGNKPMARLLLSAGANPDQQANNGYSALMWAIQNGHEDIAFLLTDAGADVNLPDNDGRSPLMVAAEAGMLEVVKRLLKKGANLKCEIEGDTARDLVHKLIKSKSQPKKKRLFQRIKVLLKNWEEKPDIPAWATDSNTANASVTQQDTNAVVDKEKAGNSSEHSMSDIRTTASDAHENQLQKQGRKKATTPPIHALLDDINALAQLLGEKPYTLAENGRPLFIDIIIKSIGTKGSAWRYRDILEKLISRTQLLDLLLHTLATTSKSDGGLNLFHAIALLNGDVPHVKALFDSLRAIIITKDPETNESYVSKEVRAALNQPDNNGRRPLEVATNEQTKAYLCTLGASDTSPSGHPTEAISNNDDEKQDEVSDNADNTQDPRTLHEGLLQAVRGNKAKEIRSLIKWMIAQGLKSMISRQMAGGNTLLHIAVEMNNLEAVKALTGRHDISMLPQARKTTKATKKKRKKKKKQAMDDGLTMQFGFSAKNNDGLTALALAQKVLRETAMHSPEHATREAIVRHLTNSPAVHQGILPEELTKNTFSDSVSQFHAAVQAGNAQRVRALLSQEASLALSTDPKKGTTALQTAAQRNRTEIMGLLLAHGARGEESIRNFTHKETTSQGRLNTDQLAQLDQAFNSTVESFQQRTNTWKQLYDHVQERHLSATQGGNTDTNSGRFYDRLLGPNPAKSLLGLITAARETMLTSPDCVQYRKGTHLKSDFVSLADHEVGLHEAWIVPVCARGIKANVVAAMRNGKMKIITVYPAA